MEERYLVATIGLGLAVLTVVVALMMDLRGGKDENPFPLWLSFAMAWTALWVAYLVQKGVL